MTTAGKIIAITILWFVFGLQVYLVCSYASVRTVIWVLGITGGVCYLTLLTVLFFVKGRG